MHLVCLGVMKRLILQCWLKDPLECRIGRNVKNQISIALRPYMPREFSRNTISLDEVNMWKTTEFRTFLLYTGPVILKSCFVGRLKPLYKNLMLLSVGIHILVSPVLCQRYSEHAKELLLCFVNHYALLFGRKEIVYNIHNLLLCFLVKIASFFVADKCRLRVRSRSSSASTSSGSEEESKQSPQQSKREKAGSL